MVRRMLTTAAVLLVLTASRLHAQDLPPAPSGFGWKDRPHLRGQVLAIGNVKTNTLYLIMFESPEALWDEAWKKGEVMLRDFRLDDEI